MSRTVSLALVFLFVTKALGQTEPGNDFEARVKAIQNDRRVVAAHAYVDNNHDGILREWTAITEINAPSGQEKQRAAYLEKLLRKYRLQDVHYDEAGNLIGTRKGTGGGPVAVFDAHLDTVFQPGLKIKATVRDGRMFAGVSCEKAWW